MSTTGIRFVSNLGHDVLWSLDYNDVQGLEKEDRIAYKQIPDKLNKDSGLDLKVKSKGGMEYMLKKVDGRDEAFSQIVGFSEIIWQVVW